MPEKACEYPIDTSRTYYFTDCSMHLNRLNDYMPDNADLLLPALCDPSDELSIRFHCSASEKKYNKIMLFHLSSDFQVIFLDHFSCIKNKFKVSTRCTAPWKNHMHFPTAGKLRLMQNVRLANILKSILSNCTEGDDDRRIECDCAIFAWPKPSLVSIRFPLRRGRRTQLNALTLAHSHSTFIPLPA